MRYRKLSPTGDYTFGNGALDFYTNVPEAVGQAVKTRLLLWLGEWYLDTDEGTPYMQGILGNHTKDVANATIQDRALGTQGITDLQNYVSEFDADSRTLTAQFSIDTIYGPTVVELQNYRNF